MNRHLLLAAVLLAGLTTSAFAGPSFKISINAYVPTPAPCAPVVVVQPVGRYVNVVQRTWVPGYTQTVYVPTSYTTAYDRYGNAYTVVLAQGHYETQTVAGYYREETVRQWVAYDGGCGPVYTTRGYDRDRDWDRGRDRRDDGRRW